MAIEPICWVNDKPSIARAYGRDFADGGFFALAEHITSEVIMSSDIMLCIRGSIIGSLIIIKLGITMNVTTYYHGALVIVRSQLLVSLGPGDGRCPRSAKHT